MRWIGAYAATLAAILALDFIWLGLVAVDFYREQLGALLLANPRWGAAILFYVMYAAATVFFAVAPTARDGGWPRTLAHGALFGLACYATYDLTNLATIVGWSMRVVVADIAWGMAITGAAALAGRAAWRALD